MDHPGEKAVWNEVVGEAWVTHADQFDAALDPFGRAVMDRLHLEAGERVLDIGCGTGRATLQVADRVRPGAVTGVDLSVPMLAAARHRAEVEGATAVTFVEADVQTHPFGDDALDVAFSRFGVMFFPDPGAAFRNVRSALTENGRIGFCCFQGPEVNPFIVEPLMASGAHLTLPPLPDADAPTLFSLALPERIAGMLTMAGFDDVVIEAGPSEVTVGPGDGLPAVAVRILEQNPLSGPALDQADPGTREAAVDAVVEVLSHHVDGDGVRMGAGTWIVTAAAAR